MTLTRKLATQRMNDRSLRPCWHWEATIDGELKYFRMVPDNPQDLKELELLEVHALKACHIEMKKHGLNEPVNIQAE